jgi:glutaredoxin
MAIEWIEVNGLDKGDVKLYALSTCVWCNRTKRLLDKLGVAYRYLDVDLMDRDERRRVEEDEVHRWNPKRSYPTLIIGDAKCILGFKEEEIIRELGE